MSPILLSKWVTFHQIDRRVHQHIAIYFKGVTHTHALSQQQALPNRTDWNHATLNSQMLHVPGCLSQVGLATVESNRVKPKKICLINVPTKYRTPENNLKHTLNSSSFFICDINAWVCTRRASTCHHNNTNMNKRNSRRNTLNLNTRNTPRHPHRGTIINTPV